MDAQARRPKGPKRRAPNGNGQAAGQKAGQRGALAPYGALDLGTNNCRLLIARPSRHGLSVVDAYSRIVRLGEGLGHTGLLSEAAMDRTIEALRVCSNKLKWHNVGPVSYTHLTLPTIYSV